MFSNSLKNILQQISQQPGWEQYRQHCELIECWQKITNQKIAQNTRPRYISRQVLWVATSSSVWAQELSLQRYSLLKKLNSQLTFTLTDIRFSPANWQKSSDDAVSHQEDVVINPEKSTISRKNAIYSVKTPEDEAKIDDPQLALQKWLEKIKARAQSQTQPCFPCPQCNSPTPVQELERWNVCGHCIAHKWSLEYRPPTQNKRK